MRHALFLLIGLLLAAAGSRVDARPFTSSNGKKIEAELISATDSLAELKVVSGQTYKVPLKNLSKEDREYIAEWRAIKQKADALKGVGPAEVMQANGWPGTEIIMAAGMPVVEINLDGHAVKFLLNPITPQSLLVSSAAETAGIQPTVPEGAQLPQGIQGVASPNVDINGQPIAAPLKLLVVEPAALSEKVREQVEGFIGSDFLKESGAVIDWAAGKIWFPPTAASAEPDDDPEKTDAKEKNGDEDKDKDKN